MKKIMWFFTVLPIIVTGVVLQFMPDKIPMHYDLTGNTDRWGSKIESFIFPIVILVITLFWQLLIKVYEKKAVNSVVEKEQMRAKSTAKILYIVGLSETIMFGIMHYFTLYSSYVQASKGENHATIDIAKVSCVLCGILFIVLGNFMTKSKKNAIVGVKTVWSMYNDNTWRKSNRLGAISFIVAGLFTIVTAAFAGGMISTICLIAYIIVATIITVIYSKKVYDSEIAKEKM